MFTLKNNHSKKDQPHQFNPYSIDKLSTIKPQVKIGFMKFWVAGAAFFLTFTALQYDPLDLLVVMILIMILGTEYVVNKVIIWMNNDRQPTLKYLPHHIKRSSVLSLMMTGVYVIVLVLASYFLIEGLLTLGIPSIGMIFFGFENRANDPITFGLVFMGCDMIWVYVKNLIRSHLRKGD